MPRPTFKDFLIFHQNIYQNKLRNEIHGGWHVILNDKAKQDLFQPCYNAYKTGQRWWLIKATTRMCKIISTFSGTQKAKLSMEYSVIYLLIVDSICCAYGVV